MKNFTAYQLSKSFNKGTNNVKNLGLNHIENSPGGGQNSAFLFKLKVFFMSLIFIAIYRDTKACALNSLSANEVCVGQTITLTPNLGSNCTTIVDYVEWNVNYNGTTTVFATNVGANMGNQVSYVPNQSGIYTFTIVGWVSNVATPGWVSNSISVNVISQAPQGIFLPAFNLCVGQTSVRFELDINSGLIDFTLSSIDLDDNNNIQTLTSTMFAQLTSNNGLNTNFSWGVGTHTVVLYLVNACGATTITQTYQVYDNILITTPNIDICEGATSVTLAANNVPAGATVEWFTNGILIGVGNPLPPIPAPINTTTYTAIASLPGGCSGTSTLTVNVIPVQTIEIDGPPTNCNFVDVEYTISNPIPGVVYTWNVTNGTASSNTGNSITIDWDYGTLDQGGTITVSSAQFPCLVSNTLIIEPCCAENPALSFVIDGNSDNDMSTNAINLSQIFGNSNTTLTGPLVFNNYNNLVLGGTIIVDINLTITNNMKVEMLPNAAISVAPGFTLTIENGTVLKAACKEMWQGITVPNGANLVLNTGCIIQDAMVGVLTGSNSNLNFGASGAKVRFNKNYVGLYILNHSNPSNLTIKNTVFECRAGAYSNDELLLSPYAGEMSAIGVYLYRNIPTITIGEATSNFQNIFDNLLYGVLSIQSNFTLHNNLFQNIYYDSNTQFTNYECDCRCPKGTAVCADGRSVTNGFIANIGGPGAAKNIVTNSFGGFYLYRNVNAVITNNDMLNIESNGMQLFHNYALNGFYDVNHNSLKDVQDHNILIFDNPKITKDITFNEINESYTPQSYLYSTGINIVEFSKPTHSTNILHNDIEKVKFGITTNLVYNLTIDDNEIDLSTDPLAVYGAGIKVENSQKNSITNNTIRAAHRNNWWVDGIRLEYTPKTTVSCNVMERTASGVFLNGDCSDSRIFQNNFRRNYWGYIINGAITGLQQPNKYSDNMWTGPYDVNTDWMGGTYWHSLNQNSNVLQNEINVRPTSTHTVYKPLPFYASNNLGNQSFNLQPDPIFPTVGPIFYSNLENNNNDPFYDECAAVADSSDGDENMIQQIVSGNYQSPQYNEETNWWMQYQLYIRALNDPDLINQFSLQQFIENMQQAAAGKLENIAAQLSDSTGKDSLGLQQLKAQNQAIGALNTIEEQFKWVNDKTIDAAIAELDDTFTDYNLNASDMETLEALAWDCPFDKGPAVFAARALMVKLNPKASSFINVCETVQADENNQRTASPIVYEYEYDPTEEHDMDELLKQDYNSFAKELKLYPNPSNSVVTLESAESITRVEISNTLGQVILIDNGSVANIKSFNLKDLPKGLYLIKVYNNDNFAVKQLSLID